MLLQQTFVLKKKYSKCQSRNFWRESRLAQEKTLNPTQLGSSHSWLFICRGLSHKTAFLYPASRHDSNMKLFVILQTFFTLLFLSSSHFLEDARVKRKILHFWFASISSKTESRTEQCFMSWCHGQKSLVNNFVDRFLRVCNKYTLKNAQS